MVASQSGDQDAYASLLAELGEAIEIYLVRRLGRAHFIEDCVQESLLAVHAARHTYDPSRPFQPWLFAIVRHKTIDWLRQAGRYQATMDHVVEGEAHSDEPAPVNEVVGDCFSRLNRLHQQALTLTKLHGYSVAEAASLTHVSETAMKVRVHRGLKKLRQLLEDCDDKVS
jgi:RNA polymerase sigma-70 factor (ECF subfamily)